MLAPRARAARHRGRAARGIIMQPATTAIRPPLGPFRMVMAHRTGARAAAALVLLITYHDPTTYICIFSLQNHMHFTLATDGRNWRMRPGWTTLHTIYTP